MERALILASVLTFAGCGPSSTSQKDDLAAESFGASGPSVISFSRHSVSTSGALQVGRYARIEYAPERLPGCRLEVGGEPRWTLVAFVRLGAGPVSSYYLAGWNPANLSTPVFPLTSLGDMEVWFQVGNNEGCSAYDSAGGANYRFPVEPGPAHPGWVGNFGLNHGREGSGCDGASDFDDSFEFDTWVRERATDTKLCFEAWKRDVTDWDNPDIARALETTLYVRYAWHQVFRPLPVVLEGRRGNNARFNFDTRALDPFPKGAPCPTEPFTTTHEGDYVLATSEFFFTINGLEVRPAAGGFFVGHFNESAARFAACPRE